MDRIGQFQNKPGTVGGEIASTRAPTFGFALFLPPLPAQCQMIYNVSVYNDAAVSEDQ